MKHKPPARGRIWKVGPAIIFYNFPHASLVNFCTVRNVIAWGKILHTRVTGVEIGSFALTFRHYIGVVDYNANREAAVYDIVQSLKEEAAARRESLD